VGSISRLFAILSVESSLHLEKLKDIKQYDGTDISIITFFIRKCQQIDLLIPYD
jgi:hypothetical protein